VIAEQRDGLCTPLGTVRSSSRNAGPLGLWAGLCVVRTYVRCHVLSEVDTPSFLLPAFPPPPRVPPCFWGFCLPCAAGCAAAWGFAGLGGARLGCLWAYQRGVLPVFLGVLGVGWGFFLLGDAV
jgi:hypothetical protein